MKPYDIIMFRDRKWEVVGEYLGALGQEDVIGIRPIDGRSKPTAHGEDIHEMFVPRTILQGLILGGEKGGCYRVVAV